MTKRNRRMNLLYLPALGLVLLFVLLEDIILKNKPSQNAGNPQPPTPQGQPKK